jgi:hypothetical protein
VGRRTGHGTAAAPHPPRWFSPSSFGWIRLLSPQDQLRIPGTGLVEADERMEQIEACPRTSSPRLAASASGAMRTSAFPPGPVPGANSAGEPSVSALLRGSGDGAVCPVPGDAGSDTLIACSNQADAGRHETESPSTVSWCDREGTGEAGAQISPATVERRGSSPPRVWRGRARS